VVSVVHGLVAKSKFLATHTVSDTDAAVVYFSYATMYVSDTHSPLLANTRPPLLDIFEASRTGVYHTKVPLVTVSYQALALSFVVSSTA
jgi:hypothetical protein